MSILESVEWVRGFNAETTARRATFTTLSEAFAFGSRHADNGRRVAYSSEVLAVRAQGPIQQIGHTLGPIPTAGVQTFFVVTVRPVPTWEKHAQENTGHGLTGYEPSRAPTKAERRAAEVAQKR